MGRRVITSIDAKKFKALRAKEAKTEIPKDDMASQIVKYIPGEIITVYLAIQGTLSSVSQVPVIVYWILFAGFLLLTPVYTWRVTVDPKIPGAKAHTAVATIAFALWVFAIGGPFVYLSWYMPIYGDVALPIYTIVVPIILGRPAK